MLQRIHARHWIATALVILAFGATLPLAHARLFGYAEWLAELASTQGSPGELVDLRMDISLYTEGCEHEPCTWVPPDSFQFVIETDSTVATLEGFALDDYLATNGWQPQWTGGGARAELLLYRTTTPAAPFGGLVGHMKLQAIAPGTSPVRFTSFDLVDGYYIPTDGRQLLHEDGELLVTAVATDRSSVGRWKAGTVVSPPGAPPP